MRKSEHNMDDRTDYLSRLGYETRDMQLAVVWKWIAALIIGSMLTAIATYYGVYVLFVKQEVKQSSTEPLVNARKLPPEGYPRVQARPKEEITEFRKEEDERVTEYAWKDKQKGIVRIPVDRAMNLILQKGLPVRNSAGAVDGFQAPPVTNAPVERISPLPGSNPAMVSPETPAPVGPPTELPRDRQ